MAESVDLLLRLDEPADSLCNEFLKHADNRLEEQLKNLNDMCENDVIEFVDAGSSGFLGDLCLVVASYNDMFVNRIPPDDQEIIEDFDINITLRLDKFIINNMDKYFELMRKRFEDVSDTAILVRGLDRFYRRLQAMNILCNGSDFSR